MAFTIRVEVFKADELDAKKVVREVDAALKEEGKVLQREFKKTVSKWEHEKPTFSVTTGGIGGGARVAFVHCYPDGNPVGVQKWLWLEDGTPEHPITPHGNYPLRFPFQGPGQSYSPRTRPGYLGSDVGSGKKAGPMSKFYRVTHPGNEARNWSQTLGEQEAGPFAERMQAAVDRGLA